MAATFRPVFITTISFPLTLSVLFVPNIVPYEFGFNNYLTFGNL